LAELGNDARPKDIQDFIRRKFAIDMVQQMISVYKGSLLQRSIQKRRVARTDMSGVRPNWLAEAVGDSHDPEEIAQAILRSEPWTEIVAEAVREAEDIMQARQSGVGSAAGDPNYNQEVARAIVARLATLYPSISLLPGRKNMADDLQG
jgi:hypothetical protein